MSTKKDLIKKIDPFLNRRFRVEIDGVAQASFCEVTIPDSTSEIIEYREGTDAVSNTRKLAGSVTYGTLVLKSELAASMELYNWRKMVEQGRISSVRKNLSVILIDEEGNDAARWDFTNAWPSKYKAPDLNAKGNEVAMETLEIAYESMQRVK
jgi:phage tail-like protein